MVRRLLLGLLFFLCVAVPPAAAEEDAGARLARQIEKVIARAGADKAFWGLAVYSPSRGQTLYALNAHRYFSPASVAKLFTTAAALDLICC